MGGIRAKGQPRDMAQYHLTLTPAPEMSLMLS